MADRPVFDDTFFVVKTRADVNGAYDAWQVAERAPLIAIAELRRAIALSNAGVPLRHGVAEVLFIDPIMRITDGDLGIPPSPLANELQHEHQSFEFVSTTAKRFYERNRLPLRGDVIGTLKRSQLPRVLGTQLRVEVYETMTSHRSTRS